jgi:hypothetical protein
MSPQILAESDDCEIACDSREAWAGNLKGTNDRAIYDPSSVDK